MGYIVRDKEGVMFMECSNKVAEHFIVNSKGCFRPYKKSDGTETTCFEVTENSVYGNGEFKVFIWEGSKLIPNDKA